MVGRNIVPQCCKPHAYFTKIFILFLFVQVFINELLILLFRVQHAMSTLFITINIKLSGTNITRTIDNKERHEDKIDYFFKINMNI